MRIISHIDNIHVGDYSIYAVQINFYMWIISHIDNIYIQEYDAWVDFYISITSHIDDIYALAVGGLCDVLDKQNWAL